MTSHYPELAHCTICPQNCGADRYNTVGFCKAGTELEINLYQLHHGEEPVLSGTRGSGTVFFSLCNLQCVFCQNYTISALGWGKPVTQDNCVSYLLDLQAQGAHNINLVSPTQYTLQLIDVIKEAHRQGLTIPVVWNSNGYEKREVLARLQGCVDIYLPDLKYAFGIYSKRYSHALDYPAIAREAILEMHSQVGNLVLDEHNIARKGLIIRLLVLPNRLAGTVETLHWIHDQIGNEVYISLMAQYYPAWKADDIVELNRGIAPNEYEEVLLAMEDLGFTNGFVQEISASDEWTPKFEQQDTTR